MFISLVRSNVSQKKCFGITLRQTLWFTFTWLGMVWHVIIQCVLQHSFRSQAQTHAHAHAHNTTDETKRHNFKFSFNKSLGHVEQKLTQHHIPLRAEHWILFIWTRYWLWWRTQKMLCTKHIRNNGNRQKHEQKKETRAQNEYAIRTSLPTTTEKKVFEKPMLCVSKHILLHRIHYITLYLSLWKKEEFAVLFFLKT